MYTNNNLLKLNDLAKWKHELDVFRKNVKRVNGQILNVFQKFQLSEPVYMFIR